MPHRALLAAALAAIAIAVSMPQPRAAECLTTQWWDTVAESNGYVPAGVYGPVFIAALKALSRAPETTPPQISAAAKVAAYRGRPEAEVLLKFFDADGCDVGRWSSLTPPQFDAVIKAMGPSI